MKLHPDDPKLTAYALGELSAEEAAAIENVIAESAEAKAWVADVEVLAGAMRDGFGGDLVERPPVTVLQLPTARSLWAEDRWSSLAAAAVVMIAAVVAAVTTKTSSENSSFAQSRHIRGRGEVQTEIEAELVDFDATGTLTRQGDRFVAAADNPIATFPIEVGKASYADVQRTITSGSLPRRGTVRIEDMINYFTYDDPPPESGQPLSITAEVAGCPWRPEHRLVRVALRASGGANDRSAIIAQDVTAQLEFNATSVTSYRLVGYDQALKDGAPGEIHSGDAVTVLYEVVPSDAPPSAAETFVVKVYYKQPARDVAEMVETFVTDEGQDFASASPDFRFAAAVADFGMFLRDSSVENRLRLRAIADLANKGRGSDPDGRRAGFIELIRQTQLLTRG
ncbi:MAG: von Willebrand factor type A domain-containing protein [Chthoniobacterales bacterium]